MMEYEGTIEFRNGDAIVYRPILVFMAEGGTQGPVYLGATSNEVVKHALEQAAQLKSITVYLPGNAADVTNALEGLRKGKKDARVVLYLKTVVGTGSYSSLRFEADASTIEDVQVVDGPVRVRIAVTGARVVPQYSGGGHGHHQGHHGHHGHGSHGYGRYGYGYGQGYDGYGHGHHHGRHGHHSK